MTLDPYSWEPGDEFIIGDLYPALNGATFIFGRIANERIRGEIVGGTDRRFFDKKDIAFAMTHDVVERKYLTPLFKDVSNVPEVW